MNISVIIPTFNRQEHILNALKSVQNQTIGVNEIIIVDDGSTDNTRQLLENHNITYIYQENQGVSKARNTGIEKAQNEWIAFLDSDDTWHEEKIESHVKLHQYNKNLLASFSDELWIRNNKIIQLKSHQQKQKPTFINSLRLCKIGTSTFFSHKSLFETVGLFDQTLEVCEDYDLWLRILLDHEIAYIDTKLTNKYAGHENQLSFNSKLIDSYRIKALEKHIHTQYQKEVIGELIYKIGILLKGATKHQNSDLIAFCEDKLRKYQSL